MSVGRNGECALPANNQIKPHAVYPGIYLETQLLLSFSAA